MKKTGLKSAGIFNIVFIVFIFLFGLSPSLMIAIDLLEGSDSQKVVSIIMALAFWCGLLGVVICAIIKPIVYGKLKEWAEKSKKFKLQKLPGIIHFEKNAKSIICYSIIAVGAISCILDVIIGVFPLYIVFPLLSITIILFLLHCELDGKYSKVYKYVKENSIDESK